MLLRYFLSLILSCLVALTVAQPLQIPSSLQDNNDLSKADKKKINEYVSQLSQITNDKSLDACARCQKELAFGQDMIRRQNDYELVPKVFEKWCKENKIHGKKKCSTFYGRTTVNQTTMGTDFANMLTLMNVDSIDSQYYCFYKRDKACKKPETPDIDLSEWLPPKPNGTITPKDSGKTFNVLHMSDYHMEKNFKAGSEANCTDNGMCCTPHNKNSETPDAKTLMENKYLYSSVFQGSHYQDTEFILGNKINTTGSSDVWIPTTQFGHYNCDAPELLINSSLKAMYEFQKNNNLNFEFAIFTGDLVDHEENEFISIEDVIYEETQSFRDTKKFLGSIPVYSVMGNHDTFPYGQIAQKKSGFSNKFDWNAELMAELWEDNNWIDQSTAAEVKSNYCGYSTTTKRGLKIIAINSNTYYQKNLYSYWNMTEPDTFGTLRWLIDELTESEKKNQRVWIMAHIPFIDYDALPIPAKLYVEIIKRFSPSTIAGIFFGHTHQDEFSVLYAGSGEEVGDEVNFLWISQSITPINSRNPGWRYYEVDTNSFNIMNSVNYFTRLNSTFEDSNEPKWEYLYSARESYNMEWWPKDAPLNATFWSHVSRQLQNTNGSVIQEYGINLARDSPHSPNCNKGDCYHYYCYTSSFTYDDYYKCLDGKVPY